MNTETALAKFTTTLTAKDVFCGNAASIVDAIKKEALSYVNDPATPAGRKEIISLAAKVAKSKTFLDKLGKDLTEDWRTQTGKVNEERRFIVAELDALRDTIRQPVTEYEQRETQRVLALNEKVAKIRDMTADIYVRSLTSQQLAERIAQIEAITVTADEYQEYTQQATTALAESLCELKSKHEKTLAYEQQQIEIARLRKEAEERAQADRDAEIARQATLKAEAAAAFREAELVRKAANDAARAEAQAAKAKADAIAAEEAAKQREAAAVAKAKADADAAHKAELDRVARIEADRKRIESAEQAAEAKRKADQAHINSIKKAALESCLAAGFERDESIRFLKAVADGLIANVSINY